MTGQAENARGGRSADHLGERVVPRALATAAALAATLGLAAVTWIVSVHQMSGMDMGVATELGSFGFFVAMWASMMAAMMLPGATPVVLRLAHTNGVRAVPLGVMSLTWMAVTAVLVVGQKLLLPRAAVDVPVGLAIVGLGILIIIEPSLVPGLTPPPM